MNRSAGAGSRERARVLNAVPLQNAVLCAECDVVSDSPHDVCMVCGSHSLFNVARIFGGKLPQKRVSLITQPAVAEGFSLETVLVFPKPHRPRRRATGSRQLSVVALEGEGAQPQHGMLVGSQSD
jgi:hypothetical protein